MLDILKANKSKENRYLGVRVPAYNETDWSRATFTEDGIGLTESSMTKTD